jgi:micrococcal nuclease
MKPGYRYAAAVVDNHDGDTLTVDIDLGLFMWRRGQKVRLQGVNCPEMSTPEGQPAKDFTAAWLAAAKSVVVDTILTKDAAEKYGRLLAVVWRDDDEVSLNDALLAAGHAVPMARRKISSRSGSPRVLDH